jgi:hypothetical protein
MVRDLASRAAFLFRTDPKLFRSLTDDLLLRQYAYYACTNIRSSRHNVHQPVAQPDGL